MSRASLITLFAILLSLPARAEDPCGDRLRAFNLYEMMEDGEIQSRYSIFPLPEDWSDASAFHGLLGESGDATLEVMVEGKRKTFAFGPWEKDPSLFVAEGFRPKKLFKNSEPGSHFILRLKREKKVICEERREISGD
jgi:hypothetical protein